MSTRTINRRCSPIKSNSSLFRQKTNSQQINRSIGLGLIEHKSLNLFSRRGGYDPSATKARLSLAKMGRQALGEYVQSFQESDLLEEIWIEGPTQEQRDIQDEEASVTYTRMELDVALGLACTFRRHNKKLRVLRLTRCFISGNGMETSVLDSLQGDNGLEELYLEQNTGMCKHASRHLAAVLQANRKMRILHLKQNNISSEGVIAISKALSRNKTLEELCLEQCDMDEASAEALGQMLMRNQGLKILKVLRTESLTAHLIVILCKYIEQNKTLVQLSITDCCIDLYAAYAIGSLLKRSKTLRKLCLSGNFLTSAGAIAIADGLHENSNLYALRLTKNLIEGNGICALCKSLLRHRGLAELDLNGNKLSSRGGQALVDLMERNKYITKLWFNKKSLLKDNAALVERIQKYIRHNTAGRRLVIEPNTSRIEFISVLAETNQNTDMAYYLLRQRPDIMNHTEKDIDQHL